MQQAARVETAQQRDQAERLRTQAARRQQVTPAHKGANGGGQRGPGGAGGRGGAGDFQTMVNRLPQSTLAEFQKGEAVMVVGTSGADDSSVTAITMLGGVEAILAGPAGASAAGQAMLLSPWNMGGPAGGDAQ